MQRNFTKKRENFAIKKCKKFAKKNTEKMQKNTKISQKNTEFLIGCLIVMGRQKDSQRKKILFIKHSLKYKGRKIINMIVKLQILSYQSRGFHKFFAQLIVAAITLMVFAEVIFSENIFAKFCLSRKLFAKFRIVFAEKCENSRKSLQNLNENF